jgi:hypothetical protein
MSDYITGHAHRTIGAKYGAPTVEHMAAALGKFPRLNVCRQAWFGFSSLSITPSCLTQRPFVLWAGQMLCCSSKLLNPLGFEHRWCGREDSNLHGLPR